MKTITAVSRADLHVHSKFSNRPSEWFLRRIGAPESFMEPLDVYNACRKAGMDYVTISDHNCIGGAKEIAHLPGTFLSAELTTYFPENGCKIHCLVSGITENQFHEMDAVRENIYDLQQYMNQNRVIHTIAHPLFSINDRLTVDLFEKLIVMFNRFEGINGSRIPRACDISNAVFKSLTPEMISAMADRHNLVPVGLEPWNKTLTGGSDDHGGLYIAGAHTVTPFAPSVIDFLEFIREGQHEPGGAGGTSVRLANSLYRIAYCYYKERLLPPGTSDRSVIGAVLKTMAETPDEKEPQPTGFRATVKAAFQKKVQKAYVKTQMNEIEQMMVEELTRVLEERPKDRSTEDGDAANFEAACKLSQELSFVFIQKAAKKIRKGELIGSLQAISSLGPVALGIAPYLTAFSTQHKDETLLREVADHFPMVGNLNRKRGKKAWVTDTFTDVNGVTKTIRTLAGMAKEFDKDITVITSLEDPQSADFPIKNFKPVGSFKMPEYESLIISYPPFMEMLAYFEQEQFDEVIISTPGTLGICALGIAKMLGLKTKGIYHTDFPRFFADILEDEKMGEAAWRFMRWFYGSVDQVLVPTRQYKTLLMDGGFDGRKIDIMPRGINGERFSPARRNRAMWQHKYNRNGSFKFIYAGRVSKEKNIEVMLRAFTRLIDAGSDADLIVVGDGPQRDELQLKYNDPQIVFTGYLYGDELAEVYASADLFVFPSLTDTFGNVVLEAHASGLPAIVSNEGGPQEIVESHGSGLVVGARTPDEMFAAMKRVSEDAALYERLKTNAARKAQDSRWEHALEKL